MQNLFPRFPPLHKASRLLTKRMRVGISLLALINPLCLSGADYALKKHRIEWSGSMPASTLQ
ncbi:MAG: hypothetical protein JJT96_05055 [Opitutales bacterium]|nr:hypothetical protein [Opitutales bacterium]